MVHHIWHTMSRQETRIGVSKDCAELEIVRRQAISIDLCQIGRDLSVPGLCRGTFRRLVLLSAVKSGDLVSGVAVLALPIGSSEFGT